MRKKDLWREDGVFRPLRRRRRREVCGAPVEILDGEAIPGEEVPCCAAVPPQALCGGGGAGERGVSDAAAQRGRGCAAAVVHCRRLVLLELPLPRLCSSSVMKAEESTYLNQHNFRLLASKFLLDT